MIAFFVIQSPTACQKVWALDDDVDPTIGTNALLTMVEA
jgi:hypothetical protein